MSNEEYYSPDREPVSYQQDPSSPQPQPQYTQNDAIANLESQLKELQAALAEERRRRQEERDSAATRERVLQAQLKSKDTESNRNGASTPRRSSKSPLVPRVAGLNRAKTPPPRGGERTLGGTSARTSDSLWVASPSDSRASTPRKLSRTSTTGAAAAAGSPGSPKSAAGAQHTKEETALQHAWNKFCVKARNEFRPEELALVSSETLDNLLVHYGVTNAVEKAQVEAQWALLQEGKTATDNPTAKPRKKKSRGPLNFPNHPAEFTVDVSRTSPHLSRRSPLRAEAARSGNPNNTTSASGPVRAHSAHRLLTPRRAGAANPNDTQSTSPSWKSSVGPTDEPRVRPHIRHGMAHVPAPGNNGEQTPRGIRSEGSNRMGSDFARKESIRTGLERHESDNSKRGIKTTYDRVGSPVFVQRPSKIVSTPPHVERSRLSTDTLMSSPYATRRPVQQYEPLARRTPFALDAPSTSANSRARNI